MSPFRITAALLTLAALFSWANHRFLRLPRMVALLLLSLLLSLGLVVAGWFEPALPAGAARVLSAVDFNRTLLHGLLGYLLFAGALHVDVDALRRQRLVIVLLATVGVLISTALVGVGLWAILRACGFALGLGPCLLFGALISPTDPISVLAVLKSLHGPRDLEAQIAGESLFNDGVGVVVFSTLLAYLGLAREDGGAGPGAGAWGAAWLFVSQVAGGAALGWAGAWLCLRLLEGVDDVHLQVLLSLALVSGGFALADALGVSGPIAMVVAGLVVGRRRNASRAGESAPLLFETFWDFVDEILNAILFVLLGMQVLLLSTHRSYLAAGLLAVPVVLLARVVSVAAPVRLLGRRRVVEHGVSLMVWGGLRGGLSVAMALALRNLLAGRDAAAAEMVLSMTYVVVAFSILVQGTTIRPLVRRLTASGGAPARGAAAPAPRA